MESEIILRTLLKEFSKRKVAVVEGYNSFGYIRETDSAVIVTREGGKDAPISFAKIV